MVYCSLVIDNLQSDKRFIRLFGEILAKDYKSRTFGFSTDILSMKCVDVDLKEADNRGNHKKTMDLMAGVADFDGRTGKYTSQRLLPVELKLDCKSMNGIKDSDLVDKDSYTRRMFTGVIIDRRSVFIFREGTVINQALSKLRRWKKGPDSSVMKQWEFLSPAQFNEYISNGKKIVKL